MPDKIAWKIYEEAFPEDERRSLFQQRTLLKNPLYHFNTINIDGAAAGFVAFWALENFFFIEHFAVDKSLRGKGYGKRILMDFLSRFNSRVILEVEKPFTEEARRRISFYERLGFHLNVYDYFQPPYENGKNAVPLYIMSHPDKLEYDEFVNARKLLYNNVYGETPWAKSEKHSIPNKTKYD